MGPDPASTQGRWTQSFLTAITQLDDQIVEILDVERVLADIVPYETSVSEDILDHELVEEAKRRQLKILLVDDSSTAMTQVKSALSNIGIELIYRQDGLKGLNYLKGLVADGVDVYQELFMVITDAEMPEMDGYRLTHEIRKDPNLKDLRVLLHTSLSGNFNEAMVKKVGCDGFLSKFQPDELAEKIQGYLREALDAE